MASCCVIVHFDICGRVAGVGDVLLLGSCSKRCFGAFNSFSLGRIPQKNISCKQQLGAKCSSALVFNKKALVFFKIPWLYPCFLAEVQGESAVAELECFGTGR